MLRIPTVCYSELTMQCNYMFLPVDYIGTLFDKLLEIEDKPKMSTNDPPLCKSFHHPVKQEAIKEHQSRFVS